MTSPTPDNIFLLIKALFVLITCGGYELIECGALRSQNVVHSLFKNLLLLVLTAVCYWSTGYALAFGVPGNAMLGYRFWFSENFHYNSSRLLSIGTRPTLPIDSFLHMFLHFTFAYLVVVCSSTSFAERLRLRGYALFCILISGFVYPIVSHWVWSGKGWLHELAVKDSFGSAVVFLLAGIAGLLGTLFLGPRIGRFQPRSIPLFGHNLPVTATGNILVYIGLSVINCGRSNDVMLHDNHDIYGRGILNTVLSGASSGLIFCFIDFMLQKQNRRLKRRLFLAFSNSIIAGMVAMSAGAIYYEQWSACIIGCAASLTYIITSKIISKFKIDDPADLSAVHIGGGLVGILAVPAFKRMDSSGYSSIIFNFRNARTWLHLLWSICALLSISLWTICFAGMYFYILTFLKSFKIDREAEIRGIDLFQYGEPAYALRIYCASCGDQLQSRAANHESIDHASVKAQQNIITDAEGAIVPMECFSDRIRN